MLVKYYFKSKACWEINVEIPQNLAIILINKNLPYFL